MNDLIIRPGVSHLQILKESSSTEGFYVYYRVAAPDNSLDGPRKLGMDSGRGDYAFYAYS